MKTCAYCAKQENNITTEHIVNKAFIQKFYKKGRGYSNDLERYTENYPTIHDVCVKCNSEILGNLDSYFLKFYEDNLPLSHIESSTEITINYDFNKLSRWLLKTIYNSERKNAYDDVPQKMHRYREYIIGRSDKSKLFKIYMELLSDVSRAEIEAHTTIPHDFNGKLDFLKVGTIILKSELSAQGLHNVKNINKYLISSNFVFHIFLLDPGRHTDAIFNARLRAFAKESTISNLKQIEPKKSSITLNASTRTIIDYLNDTYEGDLHYTERGK